MTAHTLELGRSKRPAVNARSQKQSGLNFIGLGLELVNVPVCPRTATIEETGFGASQPDHELCREIH